MLIYLNIYIIYHKRNVLMQANRHKHKIKNTISTEIYEIFRRRLYFSFIYHFYRVFALAK